jgi:urease accessory protein
LAAFIDGRLATTARTDAAFAAAACGQRDQWAALDCELTLRTPSPRLRIVSRSLGRQMLRAAGRAWPLLAVVELRALHSDGPMQPVALGAVGFAAGLSPHDVALCSLHHLMGTMTTAAVRLMGLDPFDVHALAAARAARLEELADEAAAWARCAPSELPAFTSVLADINAEHHATWETRLFAS